MYPNKCIILYIHIYIYIYIYRIHIYLCIHTYVYIYICIYKCLALSNPAMSQPLGGQLVYLCAMRRWEKILVNDMVIDLWNAALLEAWLIWYGSDLVRYPLIYGFGVLAQSNWGLGRATLQPLWAWDSTVQSQGYCCWQVPRPKFRLK